VKIHAAGKPRLRRRATRLLKGLGAGIGYATLLEPHWREITEVHVPVRDLPREMEGYTIIHLTDIHHNAVAGRRYLERLVQETNALDGDMVALTGDFITHDASRMEACLDILAGLRAPDGLFATRGNHDAGVDAEGMRALCNERGIVLLANEHRVVRPGRERGLRVVMEEMETREWVSRGLVIAGVEDLWTGHAQPGRALMGAPSGIPRVLLSHNPAVAELLTQQMEVALQLSGHTHGGQVRPFRKSIRALTDGSSRYGSGLVEAPHTRVYISRGVGSSALRVRWNCRPEIARIVLHTARDRTSQA
jgi:predicted MPP superfamily phosphohydrolase